MRHPTLRRAALILPISLCLCASLACLVSQTGGRTQGNPGRAPTNGPEQGMFGGKGATTRPGSHESSGKDEADRVAGKFPAPKERKPSEEERRAAAGTTAYVDAVALEGDRQALKVTRDDFRVLVDGVARPVISIHYVFRGPQAEATARSIALGTGVVAHADEARTIVVVVDEQAFPPSRNKAVAAEVARVLDVAGSVDRVAVVALPQPGSLRFAANRDELLASAAHITGRAASAAGPSFVSFDALGQLLKDLAKMEGQKHVVIVEAGGGASTRRVAQNSNAADPPFPILDAAAAARAVVHVATAGKVDGDAQSDDLHTLARSAGGTVMRLTGASRDLGPLASALLGGYLLEIKCLDADRTGSAHALDVTSTVHGVRVLAAKRWVPRTDAMPGPVMKARP